MWPGQDEHVWYACEFGKTISSFECGKNVRVELNNYTYPSDGYDIITAAGHIKSPRIGKFMEDTVEAAIMRSYDDYTQGSVTLWGWTSC